MRIISLVPSWTEFLVDIGLSDQIQGRTKFCVRAGKNRECIPIIGGTKTFHVDRVESLKPDLIIASKEENDKTLVEACTGFADVLVTDVTTVAGAIEACHGIAAATDQKLAARRLTDKIQYAWGEPRKLNYTGSYVVWHDPMMLAGTDTFIHAVMNGGALRTQRKTCKTAVTRKFRRKRGAIWNVATCCFQVNPFHFKPNTSPHLQPAAKKPGS